MLFRSLLLRLILLLTLASRCLAISSSNKGVLHAYA